MSTGSWWCTCWSVCLFDCISMAQLLLSSCGTRVLAGCLRAVFVRTSARGLRRGLVCGSCRLVEPLRRSVRITAAQRSSARPRSSELIGAAFFCSCSMSWTSLHCHFTECWTSWLGCLWSILVSGSSLIARTACAGAMAAWTEEDFSFLDKTLRSVSYVKRLEF